MYAVISIALFCVALFAKESISAETMIYASAMYAIAGGLSYIGMQFKHK